MKKFRVLAAAFVAFYSLSVYGNSFETYLGNSGVDKLTAGATLISQIQSRTFRSFPFVISDLANAGINFETTFGWADDGTPTMIAKEIVTSNNLTEKYFPKCLVGNACVLMSDGTFKRIANIKIGDSILSYSFETQKLETQRVTAVHRSYANNFKVLTLEEDTDSIAMTPSHHIYTYPRYFPWKRLSAKEAGHAVTSEKMLNSQLKKTRIQNLRDLNTDDTPVFNLTVRGNANYFVASNPNAKCAVLISNIKTI